MTEEILTAKVPVGDLSEGDFCEVKYSFTKVESKKDQGLRQIETAQWERLDTGELKLTVTCPRGFPCDCYLSMRQHYCDRGHVMFQIDGHLSIDDQDSFPRYFFSFEEADKHVRTFLKWRLWKHRTHYPGKEFK